MAIKQLTVFIQNKKGTVVSVTEILAKNNINLRARSIAETQDFGILRLIVNDETAAEKVLRENEKSSLGNRNIPIPKIIITAQSRAVVIRSQHFDALCILALPKTNNLYLVLPKFSKYA